MLATATIPIMCSLELLQSLREWSEPVQMRAVNDGREWSLEFRTPVKKGDS